MCAFSGKDHFVLSGRGRSGVPNTRLAQVYPRRLADALVKALLAEEFANSTYNILT